MAAIWRSSNFRFLTKNSVIRNNYRTSYVVLLPEIPPETPETNAILRTTELVDFKTVTTEACFNAIAKLALEQESEIWKLENKLIEPGTNVSFGFLMDTLERLCVPLDTVWGVARALYVADSKLMPPDIYKQIHSRARKARSIKFNSKPIYEACKRLLNEDKSLNDVQKRLLKKFVLEGRLNGSELNESNMKNYIEVSRKLEDHKTKFQEKIDEATRKFNHVLTDPNDVKAFPSELLRATALDPSAPSRGPWRITLQPHIYTSFMEHCPDALLRWNVWRANRARGSSQDSSLSTSLNLEEIRFQRRDQVKFLGYKSYADMSMETKMAGSVVNVQKMIDLLLEKAFPAQEKELSSLQQFANERGLEGSLNLWDLPYWRRKQMSSLFTVEEGEIREYFPLPRVLSGLLSLIQNIFGIHLEKVDEQHKDGGKVWHPDVTLYAVRTPQGELIGHLYFDPYSRIGRKLLSREAASWMIAMRSRSDGPVRHTPVAAVVLNLTPPLHGIPSLLSFNQVQTLLGKTGHALQHLLADAPYSEVAGLTNLEWDAVQISSQFFQFWSTDWESMSKISGHFESGQPIAKEILDQLNKAAVHMSGTDLCHQLYLASLDIELYSNRDFWLDVVKRLWPKFYPFKLDKTDCHPCNFTEIVSGDMAAAYYSHIWSKMVAADVFSAFQEIGMEDRVALRTVGDRFRQIVLANGGSVSPSETFRLFRGRDPSPDALLKQAGLS